MVSSFALLLILQQPYSYSPIGKTDPFRPLVPVTRIERRRTPLERWELEQLKLVAVVFGSGAPYAMVEDPRGKGHVVRRGTPIGKNLGRVFAIRERTLRIREESYDYAGKKVVVTHDLNIPKLPIATDDDELSAADPSDRSEFAPPSRR